MIRLGPFLLILSAFLTVLFVFAVPHWSSPVAGTQLGPPGTSMIQFAPLRNEVSDPAPLEPPTGGAGDDKAWPVPSSFKNVKVLTNVSGPDFMRLQQAMTRWVSPKQGCAFCHNTDDFSSDEKPTKLAARVMLKMTRHLNASWRKHVSSSGVTCFSCHRGQPVPSDVWFPSQAAPRKPFVDKQEQWNEQGLTVREFFPREGWSEYLLLGEPGVGQSYTALPTHEAADQRDIKRLYEFMMQMSDGIGVNCGYCHNSRAFFDWSQSTPNRWVGFSGIEMTRDVNRNFLLQVAPILSQTRMRPFEPRQPILPARDENPLGGAALATCATCHHGQPRPLNGADMVQAHPALRGPDPSAEATGKRTSNF